MKEIYFIDMDGVLEKAAWLKSVGLGDVVKIFVPYGKHKKDYIKIVMNPNEEYLPVLVDDYSKNLENWGANKGYLPIKFMNGINNRPKLTIDGDSVKVKLDSWCGYSIDNRMDPKQMFVIVTAAAKAETEVA